MKKGGGGFLGVILAFLPILIFGGLIFWMMRGARGGLSQAMGIGKSRAQVALIDRPTVTFDDVAGAEESKQELAEIVEFLRFPEKLSRLGARIPKGVLLAGPPGTGKTLISKAVAGEAGVPFASISGSEFVEMFVGVGASRVRDLFTEAKENAPSILFIDEIDAVGRHRGTGIGGGNDERGQTINQILVEMDGFDERTNVIVIAATNRPDVLDPALLRPGRFDRRVIMDLPDARGREAILRVHAKGKPLLPDVDLSTVARRTHGFSGADLANLVNEAAILAARNEKDGISDGDFGGPRPGGGLPAQRRPGAQSDHSAAGRRRRIHQPPPRQGQGPVVQGAVRGDAGGDDGRPDRRAGGHRRRNHRRLQRPPEGQHHSPQDGGGVRHERRARAPHLRLWPGAGIPGQGADPGSPV